MSISGLVRASMRLVTRQGMAASSVFQSRLGGVRFSHGQQESDEEWDQRMTNFFQRKDLDGWDVRRGLQELFSIDGVPDPVTISAALHACRRVNDHSLAVRFMETLRYKCGGKVREIYPYLIQEVRPTLDQLGISTPEDLGYDKPELALQSAEDMHTY